MAIFTAIFAKFVSKRSVYFVAFSPKTKTKSPKQKVTKSKKQSAAKPKAKKIKSEPENIDIIIDSKMATLTFVDILIRQKQYGQATKVLKLVSKNKSKSLRSNLNFISSNLKEIFLLFSLHMILQIYPVVCNLHFHPEYLLCNQ